MSDIDRLLSEFIDAWNAGARPSARDYIDRADKGAERSELSAQISGFLDIAPTPPYDEATMRQLREESAVVAAAVVFAQAGSMWPSLLPRWRKRAGLTIDELAESLLSLAGIGSADRAKAAQYVNAMEGGELDSARTSRRVLDLIAQILRVEPGDLRRAGEPAGSAAAPVFRADSSVDHDAAKRLDVLADALVAPASTGDWDEVDELFLKR